MQGVHISWDVCLRLLSALSVHRMAIQRCRAFIRCDAGVNLLPKFHLEVILIWGCLMMQIKVEIRAALKALSSEL